MSPSVNSKTGLYLLIMSEFMGLHLPVSLLKPTLQAHLYPVQYSVSSSQSTLKFGPDPMLLPIPEEPATVSVLYYDVCSSCLSKKAPTERKEGMSLMFLGWHVPFLRIKLSMQTHPSCLEFSSSPSRLEHGLQASPPSGYSMA